MTTQRRPAFVVRRKDLPKYVGLGRSQIDELIRRGEFPPGVRVSANGYARIWTEDEIAEWQARRLKAAR